MTRSIGLDIGDKRVGVAISDPQGILASPLTIIHRQDEAADFEAIISIINQHQAGQIIVGLPRSMDGTLGKQAGKVKTFVDRLISHIKVPLEFRDERLSDDAIAAAIILQGYLDEKQCGNLDCQQAES